MDVLVCATGFHTSTAPPFPIYGDAGRALSDRWANRPETYLSMAVDGFPNLWMLFGPNGGGASGSLTRMIEATGEYVVKGIRKLQRENIKKMEVKGDRVRDFSAYTDAFMAKTVFMALFISFSFFMPEHTLQDVQNRMLVMLLLQWIVPATAADLQAVWYAKWALFTSLLLVLGFWTLFCYFCYNFEYWQIHVLARPLFE